MIPHGPCPRTDAHRAARRELGERCRKGLRFDVDQVVVDALVDARPELRNEPPSVARGFAQVYSASTRRARRHVSHKGCFSLNSIELEPAFGGRGRFNELNHRHRVVERIHDWTPGATRAYQLHPGVREAVNAYLDAFIRTPG